MPQPTSRKAAGPAAWRGQDLGQRPRNLAVQGAVIHALLGGQIARCNCSRWEWAKFINAIYLLGSAKEILYFSGSGPGTKSPLLLFHGTPPNPYHTLVARASCSGRHRAGSPCYRAKGVGGESFREGQGSATPGLLPKCLIMTLRSKVHRLQKPVHRGAGVFPGGAGGETLLGRQAHGQEGPGPAIRVPR